MSSNLTQRPEWQALAAHRTAMENTLIASFFTADKDRFENFHVALDGMLLDYSKNRANAETLQLLTSLARACGVEERRDAMFAGKKINESEARAVLHVALRGSVAPNLRAEGEDVNLFVKNMLAQVKQVSDHLRHDQNITDVVNIGIGGSDLGPRMVVETLAGYNDGPKVHFLSNIDGAHITQILKRLKPKSTVFIIASKTFTTLETMANANAALEWSGKPENFYAVTTNKAAAKKFGIKEDNILPMREWIGGRYSLWSAIGLPIAVAAGFNVFEKLLAGANAMDTHFKTAPLEKNMPVLLGLLGIWYRNFWNYGSHAILPYAHDLRRLHAYIQQLDMESNGKSVDLQGKNVDYATGPVIFGGPGTAGQHAFFQLLHQGTDIIPCDFIAACIPMHELENHHTSLLANALAQAKALMSGSKAAMPHETFEGNRPSTTILVERLDGYHLGMLLALYEHKIFVQGAIWNINSFDQWGVELGKKMAKNITQSLEKDGKMPEADASTQGLLAFIGRKNP
jgi:glucose-6-phosphate isomerase